MLYRKTQTVTVSVDDDAELERQRQLKRLVKKLHGRWFGGAVADQALHIDTLKIAASGNF